MHAAAAVPAVDTAAGPSLAAPRLDAPLPAALTGRSQGWFHEYRRWPVFSAAWAAGRARTVGLVVLLVFLLVFGGAMLQAGPMPPYGGFVQMTISVFVPLLLGPWAGAWARRLALRRGMDGRRELALVAAALGAVLLSVAAFNEWGAEPMKQRIAEWTGMVDESGQRKRITMSIGVFIEGEREPAAGAEPQDGADAHDKAPSLATHASLLFAGALLAGVLALPRLAREREGLRTLAAEEALARAQQQRREAELQLSVLAAQVEPHFLFNTLAGVRSAITTDPARAAALIDRLAEYLRAAIPRLRSDGGADATLAGQADIARAYLALMAARMPRLTWSIGVPETLAARAFPPLMLVSLVENAVKHGAEPKVGPVHVAIEAEQLPDGSLKVSVLDDGAGFGASESGSGIGLANIRERLRQMHGGRASLALKARPEGGVVASLTLPPEAA
jgi:signal transduction histidine kinase